jgi:Nucleotidyl transferase of unknown function (DUF2204)
MYPVASTPNGYSPAVDELTPTLKKAVAALEREGVPYLLGGSIACWARGAPALAHDLDFMIKPEDAERALTTLGAAGMREERPPEQWLVKAWDGDVLVDLIHGPSGLAMDDETMGRGERLSVAGMWVTVMAPEDVIATMLMALDEHSLDYERLLQICRAIRERVDWEDVRDRTSSSPYASAFFTLVEELGIVPRAEAREHARPRIRVA